VLLLRLMFKLTSGADRGHHFRYDC